MYSAIDSLVSTGWNSCRNRFRLALILNGVRINPWVRQVKPAGLIGLLALTALAVAVLYPVFMPVLVAGSTTTATTVDTPITSTSTPANTTASTNTTVVEDENEVEVEVEVEDEVEAGNGTVDLVIPLVNLSRAIDLAYTMRNITYELFQWELEHNITVANVTLNLGDKFLERALNLSESNATRRAATFAIVAAIHYGHAPAFAHIVLAKVIKSNLGENYTITPNTINAIVQAASELKSILLNAVNYTSGKDINTSPVALWIERGDEKIAEAQQYLNESSLKEAFKHAVSGYESYVKAYSTLVKTVFIYYVKYEQVFKPKPLPVMKGLIEKLPAEIRAEIEARIQRGEVKEVKDIVKEYTKEVRSRIEERRREEAKVIAEIVSKALDKLSEHPGFKKMFKERELKEYILKLAEEIHSRTNATGLQLLQQVLEELQNRLQQSGGHGLNIREEFSRSVYNISEEDED